jgi:hypothetical protein
MRAAKRRLIDDGSGATTSQPIQHSADQLALRYFVLEMLADSLIDNKHLCQLSWLITKAGGIGLEDLGLDPKSKSANHAAKVRTRLNLDLDRSVYVLHDVPQWDHERNARVLRDFCVRLPHELLEERYKIEPELYHTSAHDPDEWGVPSFLDHPLTRKYGAENVCNVGFYTDKVSYTKKDSFIRCSVSCVWQRRRYTSWVIQSRVLCKCGCNGLCTLQPIQHCFNASLNAVMARLHWSQRHDGSAFDLRDRYRASFAGLPLTLPRCCVTEYRGDWPEKAALAGCKNHSGTRPCNKCTCHKNDLHSKYAEWQINSFPHEVVTHESYIRELTSRLTRVVIETEDQRGVLLQHLFFKKSYPWGRVVKGKHALLGSWRLKAGFRLVSYAGSIKSIHDIECIGLPMTLHFFSLEKDSFLIGVSLLWNITEVGGIRLIDE